MSKSVQIQFLGGAGTVTGSKTLLRYQNQFTLVDCGLFQGLKKRRQKNWEPLPIDAAQVDHVLLTHGHLDHVGFLPRLVKQGFRGTIYATSPTLDVARIILRDSAKIQEEDARHANQEDYTDHDPAEPLYTVRDAENTFDYFQSVPEEREVEIGKLSVTFRRNGHILGSTFIEISSNSGTLVFSGDLGRPESILHKQPEIPTRADCLVLESTYGDRLHRRTDPSRQLQEVVRETVEKGGNLIIPSFALGRAQELIYLLNDLRDSGDIPNCPVFLDSPMGVNITELYRKYSDWHQLSHEDCEQLFRDVELVREFERTKSILSLPGTKIIIAGSGMLTGGRVLFYLRKLLDDPATTILLTGFQAEGTRGRLLHEGAHELKFHGKYYPVKADVRELTNLSAHADQGEILDWLSEFPDDPSQVFLNHGEPQASQSLRVKLSDVFGWDVTTVESGQTYSIPDS